MGIGILAHNIDTDMSSFQMHETNSDIRSELTWKALLRYNFFKTFLDSILRFFGKGVLPQLVG